MRISNSGLKRHVICVFLCMFGLGLTTTSSTFSLEKTLANQKYGDLYKIAAVTDPLFIDQWAVNGSDPSVDLGLQSAWSVTRGENIVIAILDTGITYHPDLAGKILPGYDFVSNVIVANDGDGRDPDPSDPGDWVTSSEASGVFGGNCSPADSSWHGSHVAGIAAAAGDNGVGISGVAPGAKILPVRVIGKCGGTQADILAAITWASGGHVDGVPDNQNPADVINLSLGQESPCEPATQAVINAALNRGSVIVAAAGNSASSAADFSPADCVGVIQVGSIDRNGNLSSFSNYSQLGDNSFVVAPGGEVGDSSQGILSTVDEGLKSPQRPSYATMVGTSMAAPHVAGLVALVKAADPQLSGRALANEVLKFVKVNASAKCLAGGCGRGQIDATSLGALAQLVISPPYVKQYSDKVTLDWTGYPRRFQNATVELQVSQDASNWSPSGLFILPHIEISNLIRGAQYNIRYRVILNGKIGDWTTPNIRIGLEAKAAAPSLVKINAGDGFLRVSWLEQMGDANAAQIGYLVKATSLASGRASTCSTRALSCVITNLNNGEQYAVAVAAVTSAGVVTQSESQISMPFTVPSAPFHVTASNQLTSLLVKWARPIDTGGRQIGGYVATATTSNGHQMKCESEGTSCFIEGLNPSDAVAVNVVAVNEAGISQSSITTLARYLPIGDVRLVFTSKLTQIAAGRSKYQVWWQPQKAQLFPANFNLILTLSCKSGPLPTQTISLNQRRAALVSCKPNKAVYTISDGLTTQLKHIVTIK